MLLRSKVHLLVDAATLPVHISHESPGHLVVLTFIRQNKRTDIEIIFHQIEGGVKATSYLCLLGIGIGVSSYLVYKFYAKLLSGCQLCVTSLVSRLRQKYPNHKLKNSTVGKTFHLKAKSDPLLIKSYGFGGEEYHLRQPFSCGISCVGSDICLNSGNFHEKYSQTSVVAGDWLFKNSLSGYARNAFLKWKNRSKCKSLESPRSLDLGFVSSSLLNTTSGFYTQSLDRHLDSHNGSHFGFKHFHIHGNNKTAFTCRDEGDVLSHQNESNNNLSASQIDSDIYACEASNARPEIHGYLSNSQIQPSFNCAAFEALHDRFHSRHDYLVMDGHSVNQKRKSSDDSKSVKHLVTEIRQIADPMCCSDRSFNSDWSLRESLVSQSLENDLGDTLSGIDTPDSEVFESEAVIGTDTLSDMDQLQSQLRKINDDIGNLNEQMEVLQSREDPKAVVAQRYTLGTTEAVGHLHRRQRRKRHKQVESSTLSKSCEFGCHADGDCLLNDVPRQMIETVDFLWDYQSDWDMIDQVNEEGMFVTKQPDFDEDSQDSFSTPSSFNTSHSLQDDSRSQWGSKKSSARNSGNRSVTQHSTSDMYIDDDLSALAEKDVMVNCSDDILNINLSDFHCLSPITGNDKNFISSNPLGFLPSRPSGKTNQAEPVRNKTQDDYLCAKCGRNVNIINNNISINMNLKTPPHGTVFDTHVPPSSVPFWQSGTSRTWVPQFVFSAGPSTFSSFNAFGLAADSLNLLNRWEVENVGEKNNLYQYLDSESFRLQCISQSTREGYYEVRKLFGLTYLRRIRSDNYCAVRTILYQVLVNNLAIRNTIGASQDNNKLNVFVSPQHCYLRTWNFANRLPYVQGMVMETVKDCLSCLHSQVQMLSEMKSPENREHYLTNLLNHYPEVDLKLLEAVKVLMMIKALDLYDQYCRSRTSVPIFVWLLFNRSCTSNPEMLFRCRINPLGDSVRLQKLEMHLLGSALGVKIEVIRPDRFGTDDFIAHYPDEGADAFEKILIVEEGDNHYSIATA